MPNSKLKLVGAAGLASVLALSLSACREDQRQAALPLPATTAFALAPSAMELPYAPPAPLGRLVADEGAYAWAERAYAMDEAFYDVPPDYGFYYDDVQPWVWESEDDWRMYAEPIDDGYRFYYYEPEAAYPYFIRDDRYGYGFDDAGRLVTLYDVAGQLLSTALLGEQAPIAGRYLAHSLLLARAADREQHVIVQEPLWTARAPILVRAQEPWIASAWTAEPWVEYRTRYDQREIKRLVKDEKKRERIFERRGGPREWRADEPRRVAQVAPPRDAVRERGFEERDHGPGKTAPKAEDRGRERHFAKQERRDRPAEARAERGPERQARREAPQRQKREDRGPDRQFARQEARGPEARPAEQHGRMASAQEPRGGENRGGGGDRAPKAAAGDHGGGNHRDGGGDKGPKGGDKGPKGGGAQGGGDRGGKGGGKDR